MESQENDGWETERKLSTFRINAACEPASLLAESGKKKRELPPPSQSGSEQLRIET